jgi:hypothetical protein
MFMLCLTRQDEHPSQQRSMLTGMDWLKVLGGARVRLADDWQPERPKLSDHVDSRRPMRRARPGDGVFLYAAGWGVIFAVGVATSLPYEQTDDPDFPWRLDIELDAWKDRLHEALPIEQIKGEGRGDLKLSLRHQSHIALRPGEVRQIRDWFDA